jgi:hypothetical protein
MWQAILQRGSNYEWKKWCSSAKPSVLRHEEFNLCCKDAANASPSVRGALAVLALVRWEETFVTSSDPERNEQGEVPFSP